MPCLYLQRHAAILICRTLLGVSAGCRQLYLGIDSWRYVIVRGGRPHRRACSTRAAGQDRY